MAWWCGWRTGDLVWSLWLSSLVIGIASLVLGAKVSAVPFFTVHFGLFHFVHSVFLLALFPPTGAFDAAGPRFACGSIGRV